MFLEGSWIGTTDFREVAEFIDDDSDEKVDERELWERVAKPLTEDPRVGPGELKVGPKEEERKTGESMKASRPAESAAGPGEATQYYDIDM